MALQMGLLGELEATSRLVEAARKYQSQDCLAGMIKQQATRLTQLAQADISDADVTSFLEALAASPFAEDQQKALAAAALSKQADAKGAKVSGACKQYCLQNCAAFQNYLTEDNKVALRNGQLTIETKLLAIMQRCVAVGMITPSESTRRHLLAVALAIDSTSFNADQALGWLDTQKQCLNKLRSNQGVSCLHA